MPHSGHDEGDLKGGVSSGGLPFKVYFSPHACRARERYCNGQQLRIRNAQTLNPARLGLSTYSISWHPEVRENVRTTARRVLPAASARSFCGRFHPTRRKSTRPTWCSSRATPQLFPPRGSRWCTSSFAVVCVFKGLKGSAGSSRHTMWPSVSAVVGSLGKE